LALQQSWFSGPHQDVVATLNSLGEAKRGLGRYSESEAYYLQALNVAGHLGPSGAFGASTVQNNLALLYGQMGRDREAEEFHRRAINVSQRLSGSMNPNVAKFSHDLGALYLRMGDCERALPLLREGSRALSRFLPQEHPEIRDAKRLEAKASQQCDSPG
jgi:tetratricopeptide (TPR) repeat protein